MTFQLMRAQRDTQAKICVWLMGGTKRKKNNLAEVSKTNSSVAINKHPQNRT